MLILSEASLTVSCLLAFLYRVSHPHEVLTSLTFPFLSYFFFLFYFLKNSLSVENHDWQAFKKLILPPGL